MSKVLPQQDSVSVSVAPRQHAASPHPHPHPHMVAGPSSTGIGQAGYYDKQNPLFGVSTNFMRTAGYAPLSRLIAGSDSGGRTGKRDSDRSLSHDETAHNRKASIEHPQETTFSSDHLPVGTSRKDEQASVQIGEAVEETNNQTHHHHHGLSLGMVLRKKKAQQWNPHQSLKEKRHLMTRRGRACDFSLVFAALGILLIVLDSELTEANHLEKDSLASILIQCLAVISTVVLLYLIVYYHYTELKIAAIDSGTYDWRVGLNWDRIMQCSVEFFVCAICPVPGGFEFNWVILKDPRHAACAPVRLDVVLSIPMFLRFYLVCRFIVLHSRQFQDAATRSIASLNYITMNFQFVSRTLIDENPLFVMVVFSFGFCILMAWILTQCDRYSDVASNRFYLNALWFVVVTYISIGYGDVVPLSYCARALAIFTGIVGKVVSSVLIAVISRQMQLSRGEVHVHNFVSDSKLAKERKHAAARVLQNIWHIHWYKKKGGKEESKLRQHQRHFLAAIAEFRRIKWEQRRLAEASNSFIELSISQKEMSDTVWTLQRSQCTLSTQIALLSDRLHELTILASITHQSHAKAAAIDQRLRAKLASIDYEEKRSIGSVRDSLEYADL